MQRLIGHVEQVIPSGRRKILPASPMGNVGTQLSGLGVRSWCSEGRSTLATGEVSEPGRVSPALH